jgi:hypothetical protein
MKFKTNFNYNVKLLNPVIKYIKCNKVVDCYTTKNGLLTNQKVYRHKSKKSLINYIKKEGNNFFSRKKIKENEGIKHLIVSPISPEMYNKLNDKEKELLKDIVVKNLLKNLGKFGLIGGIEYKNRGKLEHFHIHIGISEKYDISPKNINFLKRNIIKDISENQILKEKLGLKTKSELIKEKITERYNRQYYNNIVKHFDEIKQINNSICKLINRKEWYINDLKDINKSEYKLYNNMIKNIEYIKYDINITENIINNRYENIKWINKELQSLYTEQDTRLQNINKTLENELKTLKNTLQNDLLVCFNILGIQHSFFVKYQKERLKRGEITKQQFLQLILDNKYYIKNLKEYRKQDMYYKIKKRQQENKNKIKEIRLLYKNLILNKLNQKEWLNMLIDIDKKKVKKMYNLIQQEYEKYIDEKNIFELSKSRIKIMLEVINEKIKQDIQKKQELHKKIQKQHLKLDNNINNNDYDYLSM